MTTNRIVTFISVAAMALVLMGCPYSSTIPLSDPIVKVPDSFIGSWEKKDSEGEVTEIKRTGPNTFDIVQPGMEEGSQTIYKGHFSEIGGQLFLNVKEDNEYSGYYLFKIEKEGDFKMKLLEVTPYIRETFDNSNQLRAFVEKNMQNSYFFTTEESSYYKIK
jgi:hypothetical protein